jgi:hypothetical protein
MLTRWSYFGKPQEGSHKTQREEEKEQRKKKKGEREPSLPFFFFAPSHLCVLAALREISCLIYCVFCIAPEKSDTWSEIFPRTMNITPPPDDNHLYCNIDANGISFALPVR